MRPRRIRYPEYFPVNFGKLISQRARTAAHKGTERTRCLAP